MGGIMRLKNKKTGEIIEFDAILPVKDVSGDSVAHLEYGSLSELNEEWKDVPEEPKEYWYIAYNGEIGCFEHDDDWQYMDFNWQDKLKQIGNYFESKEEAELAVRKLKAWKRLKDKGFEFDGYDVAHKSNGNLAGQIFYDAGNYSIEDVEKEMNLLFGGEE